MDDEPSNPVASGVPPTVLLLRSVLSALGLLIPVVAVGLLEWLYPEKEPLNLPPKLALQALALLALLPIYLGLLAIHFWRRGRTIRAFGFEWDREANPICTKCRAPLSKGWATYLLCPCCKARYDLLAFGRPNDPTFVWDAQSQVKKRLGMK